MSKKMTFEEANAKLEQTVKNMESKSLTLQESVELYAQACELLSYCMKELENCKGQIEDINERIERIHNGEVNADE
ncbi:MAG: exodeoxyribonuclease VII small subunit [Ruminococcus sp.]|nr:exodeoxyribonuclease VII small subunit [Ruminococcus sp.]